MTARELVVTYVATLVAIVVVVGGIAAVATGLPAVGQTVGGAVDAVAHAGSTVLDLLADRSGGTADDDVSDGGSDDAATDENASGSDESTGSSTGGDAAVMDGSAGDADGADGGGNDATDTGAETDAAVVDDGDGSGSDGAWVGGGSVQNVSHESPDTDAIERGLLEGINERRRSEFVPALDSIYVDELWTIAEDMTRDMAEHGYVGTTAPDGTTATDRFERYDPRCDRIDDYDDALALAVRLDYSTVVGNETHNGTDGLVDRILESWRDERGLVDDDYDDVGVSVRHDNASDALYGAAAAC